VLTFTQYLLEFPVSDLRYFKELPDVEPDNEVEACVEKYHLAGALHWKKIRNKAFNRSREMDDGIIAMVPNDIEENWYHELGHEVFDHCDKSKVKPILDRIRTVCGAKSDGPKDRLKYIRVGGWRYSYSHSGKDYEYDELFAISFAFIEGDHGKFKDSELDADFRAVLKNLQDEPLFNKDPYKSGGGEGG